MTLIEETVFLYRKNGVVRWYSRGLEEQDDTLNQSMYSFFVVCVCVCVVVMMLYDDDNIVKEHETKVKPTETLASSFFVHKKNQST